ncbi:MAG: hypothetical protein BroJett024_23620 [Alphaproteobacteria bacterium]|nr:MAG: hypothetical protein BroJett024_23620 [Alphaproteobacteria bacterium]
MAATAPDAALGRPEAPPRSGAAPCRGRTGSGEFAENTSKSDSFDGSVSNYPPNTGGVQGGPKSAENGDLLRRTEPPNRLATIVVSNFIAYSNASEETVIHGHSVACGT